MLNDDELVLFQTIIDDISFHMLGNEFTNKYFILTSNIKNKIENSFKSKKYTEDDIEDVNRIFDFIDVLKNISNFIKQIYNLFKEEYQEYNIKSLI
jgi:hypothetical protein